MNYVILIKKPEHFRKTSILISDHKLANIYLEL